MSAVPAHLAIDSTDCVLPGCPFEAAPGSRYCTDHLTLERRNDMTASAIDTRCKREGCDEPSEDTTGPYAKLCTTHKQEAVADRVERMHAARAAGTSRSSTGGGMGSSLADQARALIPLARQLDRARAKLGDAPSTERARAEFDEASRRASVAPTPENLQRVAEKVKALQQGAPKRVRLESEVAQAERALGLALQEFVKAARAA